METRVPGPGYKEDVLDTRLFIFVRTFTWTKGNKAEVEGNVADLYIHIKDNEIGNGQLFPFSIFLYVGY